MSPRHFANLNRRAAQKRHEDSIEFFVGFTSLIGLGRFFSNTTSDFDYDPAPVTPDCQVCDGPCKKHING